MSILLLSFPLLALLAVLTAAALFVRYSRHDPVVPLVVYLAALFLFPAALVFKPMGAVGSPATIAALGLAVLWVVAKMVPDSDIDRGWQPARFVFFAYAAVMLAAYANGQLRPLTELEQSASIRALITLVAMLGLGLVIADGVPTRQRLDVVLRAVLCGAGFMALIGIVQFVFSYDPVPHLRLPGLAYNRDIVGIGVRSIFNRPWGTSQHPIEYGVVLGALVPLALHYAFTARAGWQQRFHWALVGLIAAGVPISLSRSGVVALGVAMVVMAFVWSRRRLLNVAVGGVVFTGVMWAVVPGLIGTIRSLFTNTEHDPSVQARRDRVPEIMEYVTDHPWLGHGYGTFSVEEYLLIDNQLYTSAITVGAIGLTALVTFYLAGVVIALRTRMRAADAGDQHLAQAIAAGIAALGMCLFTFDAYSYQIFMGLTYVFIGSAGALWRLSVRDDAPLDEPPELAATPSAGSADRGSTEG